MHIRNRQGQVLLIAVMLLATVITVVMTIAFNATTETQVARLESDSQKALAAAQAGVDAVIKQSISSNINIGSLGTGDGTGTGTFTGQGISGNAQVVATTKPYFVTPLLQKDEQYTFYLAGYPDLTQTPWSGNLQIYFVSEGTNCSNIALEITYVTNGNTFERYAYNCGVSINNGDALTQLLSPVKIDTTTFQWVTPALAINGNKKLVFVKVLGGRTKLGFKSADTPLVSLPTQGKTVQSEARTTSGVVKKVELFQSYPQIPSNFLMTSF